MTNERRWKKYCTQCKIEFSSPATASKHRRAGHKVVLKNERETSIMKIFVVFLMLLLSNSV